MLIIHSAIDFKHFTQNSKNDAHHFRIKNNDKPTLNQNYE